MTTRAPNHYCELIWLLEHPESPFRNIPTDAYTKPMRIVATSARCLALFDRLFPDAQPAHLVDLVHAPSATERDAYTEALEVLGAHRLLDRLRCLFKYLRFPLPDLELSTSDALAVTDQRHGVWRVYGAAKRALPDLLDRLMRFVASHPELRAPAWTSSLNPVLKQRDIWAQPGSCSQNARVLVFAGDVAEVLRRWLKLSGPAALWSGATRHKVANLADAHQHARYQNASLQFLQDYVLGARHADAPVPLLQWSLQGNNPDAFYESLQTALGWFVVAVPNRGFAHHYAFVARTEALAVAFRGVLASVSQATLVAGCDDTRRIGSASRGLSFWENEPIGLAPLAAATADALMPLVGIEIRVMHGADAVGEAPFWWRGFTESCACLALNAANDCDATILRAIMRPRDRDTLLGLWSRHGSAYAVARVAVAGDTSPDRVMHWLREGCRDDDTNLQGFRWIYWHRFGGYWDEFCSNFFAQQAALTQYVAESLMTTPEQNIAIFGHW